MYQLTESYSVCQIPIVGSTEPIIVGLKWHETYFDISLFDGTNAFVGVMTEEQINESSKQLGISTDVFITDSKTALTTNGGCDKYVYEISNNIFYWKKVNSEMKIRFGSLNLKSVPVIEALHNMIISVTSNYYRIKEFATQLTQEKNVLEKDNIELLKKIEEFVNMKNSMEHELCNKFLIVMNTKKKKISKLEKRLKSLGIEDVSESEEEDDKDKVKDKDLYECDTEMEVDSDSDATDEEKVIVNAKKSKIQKDNFKKSNKTDTSSKPGVMLPKPNKRSTDQEAGPSGIKFMKTDVNNDNGESESIESNNDINENRSVISENGVTEIIKNKNCNSNDNENRPVTDKSIEEIGESSRNGSNTITSIGKSSFENLLENLIG